MPRPDHRPLIVLQGVVTILTSILLWPLGGALILVNAVAFFASQGTERRLFAVVAITAAIGFLAVLVLGFQTGVTQEVAVVRQ